VSVSGSSLETEVVARSEAKDCAAAISRLFCSKKVTSCTVQKEQSSDSYVHSVEAGGDEEDGAVDVITEGEKDAVLVLVCLAEEEDGS
jgi:hypothetical protein